MAVNYFETMVVLTGKLRWCACVRNDRHYMQTVQSQKAVSTQITSKQIPPFDFAE